MSEQGSAAGPAFRIIHLQRATAPDIEENSDRIAERLADEAAAEGKWETLAYPGFEASAATISTLARQAIRERDHEDALLEDFQRSQGNS